MRDYTKWAMLTIILFMALVLGGLALFYVRGNLSHDGLVRFAAFIGGIGGPILSVLTASVVALGLVLQSEALGQAYGQAGMSASYDSLNWSRKNLDRILASVAPVSPATTYYALVLAHAQPGAANPNIVGSGVFSCGTFPNSKGALDYYALLHWVGVCVEQVSLFRRNHPTHAYTLQHEFKFYGDVLSFLERNKQYFSPQVQMAVGNTRALYSKGSKP